MTDHSTPRISLVCAYVSCRKPFLPKQSRQTPQKYCSQVCRRLAFRTRTGATLADRFWDKVLKGMPDECWLWRASKGSTGYGMIYVHEQGRLVGAHVVSWFLSQGEWPPSGTNVLHNCPNGDTPACVNPSHLWVGTRTDNGRDMVEKERHANQFKQVTKAMRNEIVALYLTGAWTYDSLGRRYALSPQTIYTYVQQYRTRMHTQ